MSRIKQTYSQIRSRGLFQPTPAQARRLGTWTPPAPYNVTKSRGTTRPGRSSSSVASPRSRTTTTDR